MSRATAELAMMTAAVFSTSDLQGKYPSRLPPGTAQDVLAGAVLVC